MSLLRIFGSILFPPPVLLTPPVTNYMLLYSTLLCKQIERAPGGHKKYELNVGGGGGGGLGNRIDPNILKVDIL